MQSSSANSVSMHQRVWALSLPMMLSNISLPLLGLVDTAVMGHLDNAVYLAAVSVGAMILHFIFWGFGFLRMSTVGLVAQAYGAKDENALHNILMRACIFALVIAFVLIISQSLLISFALQWVSANADLSALTAAYFSIRIWSAPASLLTYVLLGWLLGVQKPRYVLIVMISINLLNIFLDILFVVYLDMHVQGVAWASLISEYVGVFIAGFWVLKVLSKSTGGFQYAQIINRAAFNDLLSLNSNIFIRTISLLFVFAFFTTQSARAGDVVAAANAILLQFLTFMAYLLDAYAHAAEAMVGEMLGEQNKQKLKAAVQACLLWSLWTSLIFCLLYLVFGQSIIALLTGIEAVQQYSEEYLVWLMIVPIVGVWSYLFDGVFVGATWSREMRNVMLLSVLLVFLPAWYLTQSYQNHGLWFSMLLFLAARGGLMAYTYQQKLKYL